MQIKVEEKGLRWSVWTNWVHLLACSKVEFRELYYCSRCALEKIFKILGRGGGVWPKSFGNAKKENKKRIGEQLNYYWNMLLKPFFMGKKLEKTFFPTGTQ